MNSLSVWQLYLVSFLHAAIGCTRRKTEDLALSQDMHRAMEWTAGWLRLAERPQWTELALKLKGDGKL